MTAQREEQYRTTQLSKSPSAKMRSFAPCRTSLNCTGRMNYVIVLRENRPLISSTI
jgi:hypothetical protein